MPHASGLYSPHPYACAVECHFQAIVAEIAIALKKGLSPRITRSMHEEGGGTNSPFFPSSAETATGNLIPTDFFLTSKTCAEKGCHSDVYHQWNESAHHFSSFNNQWYRKSIMYMQDVNGIQSSKWCGGCHDPAIMFNGVMDRPIRENMNTPAAPVSYTHLTLPTKA